ncbi:hypothetical protein [Halobacillus sp. Cin3]|uniref:hypothetical protein n=1 Tax=Halobacillus sp. Cin3 TaxID=2928441 RepID=UPI00248E8805|nr:hypothetical protein [Halobacillus sp. Cin3]
MSYSINPKRIRDTVTVLFPLLWLLLSSAFGASVQLFLVILLFLAMGSLFRFQIDIQDQRLIYTVTYLKKRVLNKELVPEHIQTLKFFRTGWKKKAAAIKTYKGLNIPLVVMTEPEGYDELLAFGRRNQIDVEKTKDYMLLERMDS